MTNQDDMIKLIKSISGQANILTIPRVYIGFTKSHRAALFLSQCVYWSDRSRISDGWFYKSFREWNEELGLNQHAVETCVKTLKAGEWLQTKIETVQTSPTTFYRAVLVKIAESIRLHLAEPYIAEPAKYEGEHLAESSDLIQRKTISPSIKQKLSSKITGIDHKDFNRACEILKASHDSDFTAAGPVLLEADEKPYRLRIWLDSMPPDFTQHLTDALREANPRRHYHLVFESPSIGRAIDPAEPIQVKGNPLTEPIDPIALHHWEYLKTEIGQDVNQITWRDMIEPARLISANGQWTIAVPNPLWWKNNISHGLKRMYHRDTNQNMEFVFVELSK